MWRHVTSPVKHPFHRVLRAWLVHAFTATGGVIGLFALVAIHQGQFQQAFWLMATAVVVDALDGTLARHARVNVYASGLDGAMMDNILDYLNYVIVPAYFLLHSDLLPTSLRGIAAGCIVIASAFQFSRRDFKTDDHFFKGFPSYWNIMAFYLLLWSLPVWVNAAIVMILVVLVFVPVKHVYPTRLDHLTSNRLYRQLFMAGTVLWTLVMIAMLWMYPRPHPVLMLYSLAYCILYFAVSLYCTFRRDHTQPT